MSLRAFVLGRLRFEESGANAAIEFALAAPMLLVLLAGLLEISFAIHTEMQVQDAADAGALYAVEHGWDSAAISAAVVNSLAGAGIGATPAPSQFCGCPTASGIATIICTATCASGDAPGTYVRVNASAPRPSILSYSAFSLPATMSGQATVRIQ